MGRKLLLGMLLLGLWAGVAGAQAVQSRELGEPGQAAPAQPESQAQDASQSQGEGQSAQAEPAPPPPTPAPQQDKQEDTGGPQKPVAAFWFVLPER